MKGLRIELDGEANDYVGKGLSGATIVVRPPVWVEGEPLIGNTCLYGGTSGSLFAAGAAGERFAVRNSGVTAVVEGCGAHGCEYMTGGTVAVLGGDGLDFRRRYVGGETFVLHVDIAIDARLNAESVVAGPVVGAPAARLRALVEAHAAATGSPLARRLLENWTQSLLQFSLLSHPARPGSWPCRDAPDPAAGFPATPGIQPGWKFAYKERQGTSRRVRSRARTRSSEAGAMSYGAGTTDLEPGAAASGAEPGSSGDHSQLLTPRQEECLRLSANMTDKEMARALGISPKTVSLHIWMLPGALGVSAPLQVSGPTQDNSYGYRPR